MRSFQISGLLALVAAFGATGCMGTIYTVGPGGETLIVNGERIVDRAEICGTVSKNGEDISGTYARFVFRYTFDGLSRVERLSTTRDSSGRRCGTVYLPGPVAIKQLDIVSATAETSQGNGAGVFEGISGDKVLFHFEIGSTPSTVDPVGLGAFMLRQAFGRNRTARLESVTPRERKDVTGEAVGGAHDYRDPLGEAAI